MKFPHIKYEQSKLFKDRNGEPLWNFKILDPNNDYKVVAGFTGQTFQRAHELAGKKAMELWTKWTGVPHTAVYEEPGETQRYTFEVRKGDQLIDVQTGFKTYGEAKDAADRAIDTYVTR